MAISLASIRRNTAAQAPIMLIHGTPGIGKTTFAAGAPDSVFLLAEEGLGILQAEHFPLATSYQDLIDAITVLLTEEHPFKWLIVDSLSAIEPLVIDHMERTYSDKEKSYGRSKQLTYHVWRELIEGFKALRAKRGMGILMIAHTDVTKFDPPDGDAYSRYSISLNGDVHELLREVCDIIGFAQQRVITTGEADQKTKAKKAVTTNERLLHLAEKPAYIAKNRFWLPDTIPLAWPDFETALKTATQTHPTKPE
jgi:hypothetical protein